VYEAYFVWVRLSNVHGRLLDGESSTWTTAGKDFMCQISTGYALNRCSNQNIAHGARDGLFQILPSHSPITLLWHNQPKQWGPVGVGFQRLVQDDSPIPVLVDTAGPPVVAEAGVLR
jgi:hypothetical protein